MKPAPRPAALDRPAAPRLGFARAAPPRPAVARARSAPAPATFGRQAACLALAIGALTGGALSLPAIAAAQDAPEGWQMRADRPGMDLAEVRFVDMPPGWHVSTGPAVILWRPEMRHRGDYRVEAEIFLFDPGQRRESFGFFVGGDELQGPGQVYTYFLIRNGGEYLVKERDGSETRTVAGWAGHEAIRAWADRGEGESSVRNVLAMERRGDRLTFYVNDARVAEMEAGELPLDGIVGLRVNHALELHVSRLEVEALEE